MTQKKKAKNELPGAPVTLAGQNLKLVLERTLEHLRPPDSVIPSIWAERNIRIPVGNAIPGLISFDNAPYQREPLDMMADADCYRITLMWGAQVGKTQLALCGQAYHIAVRPCSQMMMQPSQSDLQVWMNSKFNPMVDANQVMQKLIAKPRGRDGVNNSTMKSYPGGFLMFAWSGSPKTTRGRSAPIIIADEVDGYDVGEEGHPVQLLWQRAATFGDSRKLIEISTPTLKGQSYIEKAFNAGDERRFYVACPHCNEGQSLDWAHVVWDGKGGDGEQLPQTAKYTCKGCGALWDDGERKSAIHGGVWKSAKPFKGHASYHLSELYSLFRPLKDIVQSYLDKAMAGDMQTFVNVSLAQTWEEQGEQVDASDMQSRGEVFNATVPMGGLVLTAGVDMQQDRLEVEIVSWGVGDESWSVDFVTLWGDPVVGDVWDDLGALLSGTFTHESGENLKISATCVDTGGTGGSTQASYDWLKGKTGRKIFGIKGVAGWGRPIVSSPQRKRSGKDVRKIDLFLVGVDEAKLAVMRRLKLSKVGAGYCHVPKDRDGEWYEQMTAERLVTRYAHGFPKREWHKTRERNEALDCRVYAYAALKIINPSYSRLAERFKKTPEPEIEVKTEIERPNVRVKPVRRSGGWVNNW